MDYREYSLQIYNKSFIQGCAGIFADVFLRKVYPEKYEELLLEGTKYAVSRLVEEGKLTEAEARRIKAMDLEDLRHYIGLEEEESW